MWGMGSLPSGIWLLYIELNTRKRDKSSPSKGVGASRLTRAAPCPGCLGVSGQGPTALARLRPKPTTRANTRCNMLLQGRFGAGSSAVQES